MLRVPRSSIYIYSAILLLLAGALLFWPGMLRNLFSTNGFEPHGYCFIWTPNLLTLFTLTDTLIGLSYVVISIALTYLVYQARHDIPFHWVFLAFGGFIVSCGITHFMDVLTIWQPLYWLSGYTKLVTAVASVGTAVLLPPLVPKIIGMARSLQESEQRKHLLAKAHTDLEAMYKTQVELDQSKGAFFASISHELRTPLMLLLGPLERLHSSTNLTTDEHAAIQIAMRNAHALQQHVDDLLDVARLQTGKTTLKYSSVDLVKLIRINASYFEAISSEHDITFTINTPTSLVAQVDQEKTSHIILNLLANAFRFVPDGGKVDCQVSAESKQVVLQVGDNGPDVRPGNRSTMFERLLQADPQDTVRVGRGSNLGLMIATEYIKQHGGTINSEPDTYGGACFVVRLPLEAPPDAKFETEPVKNMGNKKAPILLETLRPRSSGQTTASQVDTSLPLILVVEDSVDMNDFISATLATKYRIVSAFDGQDGLEKARELHPDLIISDLVMPRMGGDTLLKAVRSDVALSNIPMVMLTAKLDDETRVHLLREGAQDYLPKPFSVDEFRVRIDNLLAEKRVRDLLEQEILTQGKSAEVLSAELEQRKRQLNQALLDLRRSESRFRRLADANIIGIITANLNGTVTEANDLFLNMMGYTRTDLLANAVNWNQMTPPEYLATDERALNELRHQGVAAPWEKVYLRKDGSRVPVLIGAAMLEGSADESVCFVVDLTERKHNEETQRLLADASSVLVSTLDYDTTLKNFVEFCVPRFADWALFYGLDEDHVIYPKEAASSDPDAKSLLDILIANINETAPTTDIQEAMRTGKTSVMLEVITNDIDQLSPTPEQRVIIQKLKTRSRIVVPVQARGHILGVFSFNMAKSGRRYNAVDVATAEELGRRAGLAADNARLYAESQQAIYARDEFLSVAAHELKTPITSLRGFSQLTLRQFRRDAAPDIGRIKQTLESIDFQSAKLAKLVQQLLGFSRIQSGRLILERENMDLTRLVRGVAEDAQLRTTKHTITVEIPDSLTLYADPIRLEQVITNLVDNAIKYSPDGGPIHILLDITQETTGKSETGMARLSVLDRGLGIPEEHRAHIFDRFYQAHRQRYLGGMGLGLYISREIVALHGGQLYAEFPAEGGTTFVMELPLSQPIEQKE